MNRRTFLQTATSTTACLFAQPGWAADDPDSGPPDGEVLAEAKKNIPRHRQGDGVITVRGADGKSIPNATVQVEQLRHDFRFGCNFFLFGHLNNPPLEDKYRDRFANVFNYATLGLYWPGFEAEKGRPNYDYFDKVAEWTRARGIACKGHPLVWDFADPKWLPRDFAEIRALSNARVRDIVSRFKGRIDTWDVVNEPTHLGRFNTRLGEWAISMGAVPYVTEHLRIARAANPNAMLLVNDYRNDPPFYKILDALREDGRLLFDVVGLQTHMHDGGWPQGVLRGICDRFQKLGRPIHFTETTIVSGPRAEGQKWSATNAAGEAKQAEYVPDFYTTLFGHPSVQAITWWDFSDLGAWQEAASGWVRRDMSPKPVYERMKALIKGEWWTRAEGRSDGQGRFATRAFFGIHRVTAHLPNGRTANKEVHWERGAANQFELVV